ncbi:hypothetical protein JXR93_00330 [bacterium]|nr:hypothetical protein [bacterium]
MKNSFFINPKEPVVLVHGIGRFDLFLTPFFRVLNRVVGNYSVLFDRYSYFKGIGSYLTIKRVKIFSVNIPFADDIENRAKSLKKQILRILKNSDCERVHIIAHSMGGLDSRYMIANLDMADKVASLNTIGTPHNGTFFADWGIKHRGEDVLNSILKIIRFDGFSNLTKEFCERFNYYSEKNEAENSVVYRVYESHQDKPLIFFPLQFSWDIIYSEEGDNDGLVPITSQLWKKELISPNGIIKQIYQYSFPVSADHINQIGWWDVNELSKSKWLNVRLLKERYLYEKSIRQSYYEIAKRAIFNQF